MAFFLPVTAMRNATLENERNLFLIAADLALLAEDGRNIMSSTLTRVFRFFFRLTMLGLDTFTVLYAGFSCGISLVTWIEGGVEPSAQDSLQTEVCA